MVELRHGPGGVQQSAVAGADQRCQADGADPCPHVPVRDLGDLDAWQLSSGPYLQSAGACGTLEVNKQAANGSITPGNIPGMNDSPRVVTATGSQLLVDAHVCGNAVQGNALAWYNPDTKKELYLFTSGAEEVLPFATEADPAGTL